MIELLAIAIGMVFLIIAWNIIKGLLEFVLKIAGCLLKILFGLLALLITASIAISQFL